MRWSHRRVGGDPEIVILDSRLRGNDPVVQTIQFPSGEYLSKIHHPISSNEEVIIVGSMAPPTNDHLMKLVSIIDAARNSGARNITLIAPYLGYSRQNSMEPPYSSIGMKIIAQILEAVGVTRLITVDIHSLESLHYFSIEVIHISVVEILSYYSSILNLDNVTIIAPDKGSSERLKNLSSNIITMSKTRKNNEIYMELNGDVEGKNCLIIDDIIDSGNTMEAAVKSLKANKAGSIKAYCTHFLGNKKPVVPLYVTDAVPLILDKKNFSAILPIEPIIARVIQRSVAT
jgi:ribose-phosphate pyrophosphokinase